MTVAELFAIIAGRLSSPVESIFSAVNAVSDYLMKRAASKRLSIAKGITTVATVNAQNDVQLPADCRIMSGPPMIGTLELQIMPTGGESIYTTHAKPIFYRLEGRRMVLAPTPNAVYTITIPYYAYAEKVYELADTLPFGGQLDEAFPDLTAMVMMQGRGALATQAGEALVTTALMSLIIAEEQNLAESLNNQSQYR